MPLSPCLFFPLIVAHALSPIPVWSLGLGQSLEVSPQVSPWLQGRRLLQRPYIYAATGVTMWLCWGHNVVHVAECYCSSSGLNDYDLQRRPSCGCNAIRAAERVQQRTSCNVVLRRRSASATWPMLESTSPTWPMLESASVTWSTLQTGRSHYVVRSDACHRRNLTDRKTTDLFLVSVGERLASSKKICVSCSFRVPFFFARDS